MKVVILTCYPEMFPGTLGYSVIGNALNNKKFSLEIVNLHMGEALEWLFVQM